MPAPSIFISYRKDDAQAEARILYAELAHQLGPDALFLDKKGLQPGADWPAELARRATACLVMLVVIKDTTRWMAETAPGQFRIHDPKDWVRRELETALQARKTVIPILFDGAAWPPAHPLPDSLLPLLNRQGKKVTQDNLESDALALSVYLRPLCEKAKEGNEVLRNSSLLWVILLAVVVMALLFYGIRSDWGGSVSEEKQSHGPTDQVMDSPAGLGAADTGRQATSKPQQLPAGTPSSAIQPSAEGKTKPAVPALPLLDVKVSDESYGYFFEPALSRLLGQTGIRHRTNGPKSGSKILFTVTLLQHGEVSDLSDQASYSVIVDLSMRDKNGQSCFSKSYRSKPRVSRPRDTESQFTTLILTPCLEEIATQIRTDNPRPCGD